MVTVDTRIEPWNCLKAVADQINSSGEPDSLLRASLIAFFTMLDKPDLAELSQAAKYSLDFMASAENSKEG